MLKKSRLTLVLSCMLVISLLFSGLASAHTVSTTSGSADLRIGLSNLLGEHALLAGFAMQKGLDGAKDFPDAAAALNANSADIQKAIASVYGTEAGNAFRKGWDEHIGFFVQYVQATAKNDAAGKAAALKELDEYRFATAAFLAAANPNLNKDELAEGLKGHIGQLQMAIDAYAAKDYTGAYKNLRDAYMHMMHFGQILSDAIAKQFPDKFPAGAASGKAVELRAGLNGLLGEHALLAINAMQKGLDGKADFNAAAAALLDNGKQISGAIGSVYGTEAGTAFDKMWTDHINFFVNYVVATAKKDEAGRMNAQNDLKSYIAGSAKFLSGANPNLPEAALSEGLTAHVGQLTAAFDNYATGMYANAYAKVREAYMHMGHFGDILAGAIVKQKQDAFHDAAPAVQKVVVTLKPGQPTLWIGDKESKLDVAPFVWNGSTYVSLRSLGEAVGAEVKYMAADRTVHVMTGGNHAIFWLDSTTMTMNGNKMDTGSKVMIRDGRTQVPLRFIAELLGWTVGWDAKGNITLTKTMTPAATAATADTMTSAGMTHSH